jgi:hypothetical protein
MNAAASHDCITALDGRRFSGAWRFRHAAEFRAAAGVQQACAGPSTPTITLVVQNRGYFDVNVHVMRSPMTIGSRLGTVTGGSTQTFRVRETDLQPGGLMVLQVRAIGGRSTWTSPGLTVNIGSVARLDVIATSSGNLSQSQFYLQ